MSVEVKIASQRKQLQQYVSNEGAHFVGPGEVVTEDQGFMKGHGCFGDEQNRLCASVAGQVDRVNKLICVKPFKTRYTGEVGDVVIGRIVQVGQKRWKVETHARKDSVLMLSAVNLPGGEHRRRNDKDELLMRGYLVEGDIIVAEVQSIFIDGSVSLQTRNLKYGKLPQGVIIQVSPSLIKRCKNHIHNLPCGSTVILGNNGYIWIGPKMSSESDLSKRTDEDANKTEAEVSLADREVIARLRNSILALADYGVQLFDTSINYVYDASLAYDVKDLLKDDSRELIVDATRRNLALQIR